MAKKSLEVDMIAGSQLRDTQGEVLSVEGADISELEAGRGRLNDNHGKGFFNSIGRVTGAKKIFKKEDCENERQEYYWDKVKAPFIYVKGYLYDEEDHPNARAAAAILRNIHKTDTPLQLKASVEGGVVARGLTDPSLLARTKIHSVALTFTPANNNTLVEPLSLDKTSVNQEADMNLIKSLLHLAETNVPSFRHIQRDASATKVQQNLEKMSELMKELGLQTKMPSLSKQDIISHALEQKIQSNIASIYQHIHALSQHNEMEKGVKSALAGAALSAGLAMSPSSTSDKDLKPVSPKAEIAPSVTEKAVLSRVPANHQEAFNKLKQRRPELAAIAMHESSGGVNYDHKTIDNPKSMHHGMTAGGMFGLMPITISEVVSRSKSLKNKYPQLAKYVEDVKANHGKITELLNSDPQISIDIGENLFDRKMQKFNNLATVYHSWNRGIAGTIKDLSEFGIDRVHNSPYAKKTMDFYHEYKKPNGNDNQLKRQDFLKALTAGYGGGSPTSNSGGLVLQSESLEDPSFKYINCEKCGKEQIYAKHQVKCRECGQHFSMERLYDLMVPKK